MLTTQTPVVGICSRHFEDRCDKMIEKMNMYLTRSSKNTPLYLLPQRGRSLKIFAWGILLLVHLISFLYNAAISRAEGLRSPISDFLLIEILQFEKVSKSKQSLFTHDLGCSLVYEPLDGNTGIAIFMPTSKCSLRVAHSHFLPAFDRSSSVIKWSLIKCGIF